MLGNIKLVEYLYYKAFNPLSLARNIESHVAVNSILGVGVNEGFGRSSTCIFQVLDIVTTLRACKTLTL
jgi:hypothetical protein